MSTYTVLATFADPAAGMRIYAMEAADDQTIYAAGEMGYCLPAVVLGTGRTATNRCSPSGMEPVGQNGNVS